MIFTHHNKNIHYTIEGKGNPLVLLHGFLESSKIWEQLVADLSGQFRCIAIDLPGHGQSDVFSEEHSMEMMAETVHALLAHLEISSVILMGHSMGGYAALAYAELYPENLSKLILFSSTPKADSEERLENRRRALEIIPQNPGAFISMAIRNLFAESNRDDFSDDILQMKNDALQFPLEGILAAVRGMMNRKDRTEVLKHFSKEKYIICGDADPIIDAEQIKTIAASTETHLKMLSGGHILLKENYRELYEFMHFIE